MSWLFDKFTTANLYLELVNAKEHSLGFQVVSVNESFAEEPTKDIRIFCSCKNKRYVTIKIEIFETDPGGEFIIATRMLENYLTTMLNFENYGGGQGSNQWQRKQTVQKVGSKSSETSSGKSNTLPKISKYRASTD